AEGRVSAAQPLLPLAALLPVARRYEQHGALRTARNRGRHTADQCARQGAVAVCAEHDEIRRALLCPLQDELGGISLRHLLFDLQRRSAARPFARLLDVPMKLARTRGVTRLARALIRNRRDGEEHVHDGLRVTAAGV